jgi:hypothetical protein
VDGHPDAPRRNGAPGAYRTRYGGNVTLIRVTTTYDDGVYLSHR